MNIEQERADAEYQYSITAHDYEKNPIGSRDWTLYWRGYQAGSRDWTLYWRGYQAGRAALQKYGIPECEWVYDDLGTYSYDTSCGHLFTIMGGTLEENSMKFCCFCGGSIVAERGEA